MLGSRFAFRMRFGLQLARDSTVFLARRFDWIFRVDCFDKLQHTLAIQHGQHWILLQSYRSPAIETKVCEQRQNALNGFLSKNFVGLSVAGKHSMNTTDSSKVELVCGQLLLDFGPTLRNGKFDRNIVRASKNSSSSEPGQT